MEIFGKRHDSTHEWIALDLDIARVSGRQFFLLRRIPAGKPQPSDPTKPCTSFKTVWRMIKAKAAVKGRWHDNSHTFITGLAESGAASDQTIMDIAGHVSKRMLKHYSQIRMEAKRRAVAALVPRAAEDGNAQTPASAAANGDSRRVGKELGKVKGFGPEGKLGSA